MDDDPCSDYINASYIPVSDSRMLFYSPSLVVICPSSKTEYAARGLMPPFPLHLFILAGSLRTYSVGVLKGSV